MSTEDIKETDKEVIELLYSSEWPSVVGVGTLPSFKRFKVHGEREIWHSILYDVHVQMYQKKIIGIFNDISRIIFIVTVKKI